MKNDFALEVGGRTLEFETGRVAKQAGGAVWLRYGDTVILATVVTSREEVDKDFFPLVVDYREKQYAAGRIPGGFFKREGRPNEKEILSSRLIDRSIRPLFDKSYRYEVQVQAEVLSSDQENDADVPALVGVSAALSISNVPWGGPLGAVRMGKIGGELVVNPTSSQLDSSTLDIVVAGTEDSITMVEGKGLEISEEELLEAFELAHPEIIRQIRLQNEMVSAAGREKRVYRKKEVPQDLVDAVRSAYEERVQEIIKIGVKEHREEAMAALRDEASERFSPEFPDGEKEIRGLVDLLEREKLRSMIVEDGVRADGRRSDEIRPIGCEVGVLPRTHGSGLFTRGQTQALVVTTLGTSTDEQKIEELMGQSWKTFILHYNFPSFSVGEVRPNRGPGRREIGHGALAERALAAVVPSNESFPYTIRIVSDILESNGSSSMATVCGGSLSLMDAGVPLKAPVAGIAMGLVQEGDRTVVLSDILGIEDHLGDMDFKVTGTEQGITAIQMDNKIGGLQMSVLRDALDQARRGRIHILGIMGQTLARSRDEISRFAPRIMTIEINPDKIRDVIGPGGKVIKKITEETGATIDIEDTGQIKIACIDAEAAQRAVDMIRSLTEDPEIGRIYRGKVKRIVNFGAFVEILPGRDGLIHISELENHRVARVEDVVKEGDLVLVKVIGVDEEGKIRLSRKAALGAVTGTV
ncbi:MAG: polyribonucleotide nucleotidyltransferase [Candidatus Eisenbacteria bacterium]|nr:polyribonucleotide nucleotidyltransferase [Candidatus Latescibacterota bacterium]MBD3303455.1 polyribonucleotide nucleotidyltransferase [Candidatus Eisenbacteria bacterium]